MNSLATPPAVLERLVWRNHEVYEALRVHHPRNKRWYPQVGNNSVNVYDVFRKWHFQGRDTFTWLQLARELYDDKPETKEGSVRRFTRRLEAIGAVKLAILDANGKTTCQRFELLGCRSSSVGQASGICRGRRRRESPAERRAATTRRGMRRSGQTGVWRFGESPLFFARRDLSALEPSGGSALRASPPQAKGKGEVPRASRAVDSGLSDAPSRRDALGAVAALEAALAGQPGVGRVEALRHRPTLERLVKALARLDRYGDGPTPRPGYGRQLCLDLIAGSAIDPGTLLPRRSPARHLAYFLPELERRARQAKHRWAPVVKAERRRRRALAAKQLVDRERRL